MSLDTKARRERLSKTEHGIRVSQLIYQYGPGAMVDFPRQTLMTAAPEYWAEQVEKIHDERLERALKVDYFGMPSNEPNTGKNKDKKDNRNNQDSPGMSYVRFPEWYFCPRCRRFMPIQEWVEQYKKSMKANSKDADMVHNPRCAYCWQPLVVSRIVTVCEHGHIDDFPWVEWVHTCNFQHLQLCDRPGLKLMTANSSSEGLEGIQVVCENCGAKANLSGAFDSDIFQRLQKAWKDKHDFTCRGRHPWKHTAQKCGAFPRTMQRGSSSVYFPVTVSSLVIPPYSSLLTAQIEETAAFEECRMQVSAIMQHSKLDEKSKLSLIEDGAYIEEGARNIALAIGAKEEDVAAVLRRKLMQAETDDEEISQFSYRAEEYDALSGALRVHDSKYDGDFVREEMDIAAYGLPFLKSISLITKVREVIALTGFTRINPQESGFNAEKSGSFVPIKEAGTKWYPAYQVRGEGIFIEFDDQAIDAWKSSNPEIQQRAALLNENHEKSFFGRRHPRKITEKYLLLHTVSHLLIKQLSFECGYGIASLKEIIYCGEASEGRNMSGIFIYTAGGDSEGTLGGLVRQGRADVFPRIFRKAIESARICAGDPVCSLSNGQGRDSLNLAACYSCALIPETSCENFNAFLDRGVVVGTMKQPEIGFFAERHGHDRQRGQSTPAGQTRAEDSLILHPETGVDLTGLAWRDIWDQLAGYAGSSREAEKAAQFRKESELFSGREQPQQDCDFHLAKAPGGTLTADLIWPLSRVAVFMEENADACRCAARTDWKCHMFSDPDFTPEALAQELKEIQQHGNYDS